MSTENLIRHGLHGEALQRRVMLLMLSVQVMHENDGHVLILIMNLDILLCVSVRDLRNVKVVRDVQVEQ